MIYGGVAAGLTAEVADHLGTPSCLDSQVSELDSAEKQNRVQRWFCWCFWLDSLDSKVLKEYIFDLGFQSCGCIPSFFFLMK